MRERERGNVVDVALWCCLVAGPCHALANWKKWRSRRSGGVGGFVSFGELQLAMQ